MELGDVQIEPGNPRYPLNEASAPCAEMNRSAASSSSAVVTPGWTLERSIRRQRAWIAPDAAIRSICSGVFLRIMPSPARARDEVPNPECGPAVPPEPAPADTAREAEDVGGAVQSCSS